MAVPKDLHLTGLWAVAFTSSQKVPILVSSASMDLLLHCLFDNYLQFIIFVATAGNIIFFEHLVQLEHWHALPTFNHKRGVNLWSGLVHETKRFRPSTTGGKFCFTPH